MSAYIYEIECVTGNGSCHYCQRGTLREDRMGIVYPYTKLIVVEGNHITSNFCTDCFTALQSFKLIDSTESAQAEKEVLT